MFDKLYYYKAFCYNVVDGDTIDVTVDLGFRITFDMRLRLLGINTPEIHGKKSKTERSLGEMFKSYLEKLIVNKEIIIKTKKDKKDKYGRYLAEVFLDTHRESVNVLLKEYAENEFGIKIDYE